MNLGENGSAGGLDHMVSQAPGPGVAVPAFKKPGFFPSPVEPVPICEVCLILKKPGFSGRILSKRPLALNNGCMVPAVAPVEPSGP
jgi:hypothetical protein